MEAFTLHWGKNAPSRMIFYSYPIRSYFTLIVRFHSLYLKNGIQMELAKNKYLKQLRMKQAL